MRFDDETLSETVCDEAGLSMRLDLRRTSVQKVSICDEDVEDDQTVVRRVIAVEADPVVTVPRSLRMGRDGLESSLRHGQMPNWSTIPDALKGRA